MELATVYTSNIDSRILRKSIATPLAIKAIIYGEFEVLYLLSDNERTQPSIIGRALECEPASISRTIKQLHLKKLISYDYSSDDRRKIYIKITNKGSALIESLSKLVAKAAEKFAKV